MRWRSRTDSVGIRSQQSRRAQAGRSRGQSLAELALVLPIVLLMLLLAIDFGRLLFGYIIVNNAARIGADYAARFSTAWGTPGDPARRAEFEALLRRDTDVANCELVAVPTPTFFDATGDGTTTDVGDRARVEVSCRFRPLTPIVSGIVGTVTMTASSEFTIRAGRIAGVPVPTPAPTPTPIPTPTPTPGPTPTPSCLIVPDLVNPVPETVDQARNEWQQAGFTGTFSPNGQNNKRVTGQSLPAGSCQPPTAPITVTYQ